MNTCSRAVSLKLTTFHSETAFTGFMLSVLIDTKNGSEVWTGGVALLGFVDLASGPTEFVIVFFGRKYGSSARKADQ